MGVCILGMGDCNPKIKNITNTVNKTLNENIKQTMMSMTSNTSVFSKSRQSFNMGQINAIGCSINTGAISQDMQVSTDFKQMSKVITKRSYDQNMKAAIDTAVKSDTSATTGFMSSGADVTNTTNNYNSNVNKVLDSFNYSSFQSLVQEMDQAQEVGYAGFNMICTPSTKVDPACGANLCVGGVTQNMVVSLIASQIADSMTDTIEKVIVDGAAKVAADNKTKVVATGMFQDLGTAIGGMFSGMASMLGMAMFGPIIMIIGFILVIVIAVVAYRWATGSTPDASMVMPGMAMAAQCMNINPDTGECMDELGDDMSESYDQDGDGYDDVTGEPVDQFPEDTSNILASIDSEDESSEYYDAPQGNDYPEEASAPEYAENYQPVGTDGMDEGGLLDAAGSVAGVAANVVGIPAL